MAENGNRETTESRVLMCSECFADDGLRLNAEWLGLESDEPCVRCKTSGGRKIDERLAEELMYGFFVRGSMRRHRYGGHPALQMNDAQSPGQVRFPGGLEKDARMLEAETGMRLFEYGPRWWMFGEITPLKELQERKTRDSVLRRIVDEFPGYRLCEDEPIYRLRRDPSNHLDHDEFDSPPTEYLGHGRLDSTDLPILYASRDAEVCIHECRTTVEDKLFMATLKTTSTLRLLDLSACIQDHWSEFESLDLAVHMMFMAGPHSYEICRDLTRYAKGVGFDGVVYPSYFTTTRLGRDPFPTYLGISERKIPDFPQIARFYTIPNVALFGYPVKEGKVVVNSINRVILRRVKYELQFGPCVWGPNPH